eukprot:SRR837773.10173.p1 GENE.SRR837773.10173~~SRR837773.10173.p1  ORF type:complete len:258 (+),score=13.35 SRR837773.10173:64-774(+)
MNERLKTFTVHKCTCFNEIDRPIVYANIAALIRETHGLKDDIEEFVLLKHFDRLVRGELPRAMFKAFGRFDLTYKHLLTQSFFALAPRIVDMVPGLRYDLSVRLFVTAYVLYWSFMIFAVWPFLFSVAAMFAGRFVHWTGIRGVLWITFGLIAVMILLLGFSWALDQLWKAALESDFWLIIFCVVNFVCSVFSFFWVTSWRPRVKRTRAELRRRGGRGSRDKGPPSEAEGSEAGVP